MDSLSSVILTILQPFSILFSKPSWKKALTLILGAIICTSKRTVCSSLRAMGLSDDVSFSKYHHLLNRAKWSSLQASKILFFMLISLVSADNPIVIMIDETLERRRGKKIKAKGYYRDAVRSSKSQVVKASGLKWLVMALSIKLPYMTRAIALPFMSVLEPSKKHDEQNNLHHKSTICWACQMIKQVRRWVDKKRQLILVGDGGFAAGNLALDCICNEITLISRLKMNARLFDFPPEKEPHMRGRPSSKGKRLVNFKQMLGLEKLQWNEAEIIGYGGTKRLLRFVSTTCLWGVDGVMPIPIRWVLVIDPTGKMDPLPLVSTDPQLTPKQIIEYYVDRWGLEVTFEETREHLGIETQRQWSDKAIARSTPILMGLYSMVCLMANKLSLQELLKIEMTAWYPKKHVTFSDMLRAVRILIWKDNLFSRKVKISPSIKNISPEMAEWAEDIVKRILQAA